MLNPFAIPKKPNSALPLHRVRVGEIGHGPEFGTLITKNLLPDSLGIGIAAT
jgi:hypothetical protein